MKATPEEIRRKVELKVWMQLNEVTTIWAAKELGVSVSAVRKWLFDVDTIRPGNREALVKIGFPPALIPPGEYRKPGPTPKVPRFIESSPAA